MLKLVCHCDSYSFPHRFGSKCEVSETEYTSLLKQARIRQAVDLRVAQLAGMTVTKRLPLNLSVQLEEQATRMYLRGYLPKANSV